MTGCASWLAFLRNTPAAEAALTAFAPHWHKLLGVMTLVRVLGLPVGLAGLAQAVVFAGLLGLVGWLAWVSRGRVSGVALMAVAAAATPLISPHVLDYYLPVLLAPMAYVAGRGAARWVAGVGQGGAGDAVCSAASGPAADLWRRAAGGAVLPDGRPGVDVAAGAGGAGGATTGGHE